MDTKELIIKELEETSQAVLDEVLDFLQFLKAKKQQEQLEHQEDLEAIRTAREDVESEGTVSWDLLKQELDL
ncbi:MAG TPA: hypothetical protein V6C78_07640 [Crinalium sp.]|jgi:hypothetical protein